MKKIILILMLALSTTQMMAQNSLDTINPAEWRHYFFHYRWWDNPDSVLSMWSVYFGINFYPGSAYGYDAAIETAQRITTSDTLRIIGLASCAGRNRMDDCFFADDYTYDDQEYMRLYLPTGNGLALVDEGTFDINQDTAYMILTDDWWHDSNHSNRWVHDYHYYEVYEVYFDTTHLVADSFYVGMTMHNNWRDPENNYLWPTRPVTPYTYYSNHQEEGTHWSNWHYKEIFHSDPAVWYDHDYEFGLCIWPILEDPWPIEKRCATPDNLNAITVGGGSTITWDGPGNQTQWQVSYGTLPNQPDSGTIVDLNSNYWYHSFNDSTMNYVYIRGYCHNERCWSLWSAPLEIGNPAGNDDTNSTEGIRLASTLDRQTRLFPNPASESVTVTCGFSLLRLELCSLQGQTLLTQEAKGHAASMDVSAIQPGTYLMIVHTAAGRTAKRLVIQ